MNVFDWRGPEFILFYFVFGVVVLLVSNLIRKSGEPSNLPDSTVAGLMQDPYQVSCLRGGKAALVSTVALCLIDRGLLSSDQTRLVSSHEQSGDRVRRPVEKAILHRFAIPGESADLFTDDHIQLAAEPVEDELRTAGLLPDDDTRARRRMISTFALLILWGVAGTKILIAIQRGRYNIAFLVVMALVFGLIALAAGSAKTRTPRGSAALLAVQRRFDSLRKRRETVRPGGAGFDLAILAGVFGFGALPAFAQDQIKALKLRKAQTAGSDGGSSCGSSCGSSSCGGGGSSCGGGGCGGCGS